MGTGEVISPNFEHKTQHTASLKEHRTAQTRKLPKGLVGSKSTANVKVNGVDCHSLLDTGSQVTTVSQSFYNLHLSDHTIHPVSDILEIEGAIVSQFHMQAMCSYMCSFQESLLLLSQKFKL